MLLAQHSDRFSRGGGDKPGAAEALVEIWHAERRRSVHLRSVDDDFDLRTSNAVSNVGERNRADSERKSKSVTRGIEGRHARGLPWGAVPFGYRKREDGHWEAHPDEAPIVADIFRRYLKLTSYNGVARALDADGVPTPNGGKMWASSTVRKIINSRSVIGEYWGAGEWRKGQHKPIVDVEVFEAAQHVAEQSRKWSPTSGGRLPARHVFVKGSLRCGLCTSAMIPRTERKRGKVRETYQCRKAKTLGAEACPMPIWTREAVETPALDLFETEALSYAATRDHVAAQLDTRIADATTHAARASREAGGCARKPTAPPATTGRERLDAGLYSELRASIAEELAAAEAEAERLTAHAEKTAGERANLDAETMTLEKLTRLRAAVAGRMTGAGTDIGALRAAIAQVAPRAWILRRDPMNMDDDGFVLTFEFRPEARDPAYTGGTEDFLRRVPVPFGVDGSDATSDATAPDDNQHGTELWKYMTQYTFRPS